MLQCLVRSERLYVGKRNFQEKKLHAISPEAEDKKDERENNEAETVHCRSNGKEEHAHAHSVTAGLNARVHYEASQ